MRERREASITVENMVTGKQNEGTMFAVAISLGSKCFVVQESTISP